MCVADHDATLDRLGERLGLAPATRVRRLQSRENQPGKGLRNVRGNRIGIVPDASQAAYERLAPGEAEQIRAELGELYERLREQARIRGL